MRPEFRRSCVGRAELHRGLGARVAQAIATHHRAPVPAKDDPRCELRYLSERLDLAHARGTACELERLGSIEQDRA